MSTTVSPTFHHTTLPVNTPSRRLTYLFQPIANAIQMAAGKTEQID